MSYLKYELQATCYKLLGSKSPYYLIGREKILITILEEENVHTNLKSVKWELIYYRLPSPIRPGLLQEYIALGEISNLFYGSYTDAE